MKKLTVIIILLSCALSATTTYAQFVVGIGVHINIAPPEIPVYVQPACPTDGYIWTPGFWAYGPNGYYWVPGTWVMPARPGYLWTPGYWGYTGGYYGWNPGYWGEHIGYYGGVNYGYGYGGSGYNGGRWEGGHFMYNTAISHVNGNISRNVYVDRSVVGRGGGNRSSFNGPGGVTARPTANEMAARNESHIQATGAQTSRVHAASSNRNNFATVNNGHPAGAGNARAQTNRGPASGNMNRNTMQHTAMPQQRSNLQQQAGRQQQQAGRQQPQQQQQRNNAQAQQRNNQQRQQPQQEHGGNEGGGRREPEGRR